MDDTPTPSTQQIIPSFAPVPRLKERSNGWRPEVQRAFIEALADTGSVKAAAAAVNMSAEGAYYLRRQKGAESFRKAWEVALSLGVQRIEDVAMDRALNGVDVPVYSYGKLVGVRKNYNDRLLMFMLRNRASDRFAEGKPRAMSAMDLTRLDQEKKKWRREWELEQQAARPQVSSQEVRDSIERKVEQFRTTLRSRERRDWARLSPQAREAFVTYTQLRARDLGCEPEVPHFLQEAEGDAPRENWWDAPEDWREEDRWSFGARVEERAEAALAPPERSEEALQDTEEPSEKAGPRLRSLKDDGWR